MLDRFYLRSGNIVLAMIPKDLKNSDKFAPAVALVTSVWVGVKKPRLATSSVSINHVIGIRIIEMKEVKKSEHASLTWECDAKSQSLVLRPQTIVAILDVVPDSYQDTSEGASMRLGVDSITMVNQKRIIAEWWPAMRDSDVSAKSLEGLVLPGNGRKRKRPAAGQPQPKAPAAGGNLKKIAVVTQEEIEMTPENFRRTNAGEVLMKQTMIALRKLDMEKFPNQPLWTEDDLCKFQRGKCHGISFNRFKDCAFPFFKALHPKKEAKSFGNAVHNHLIHVKNKLNDQSPDRKPWLVLLKEISEAMFD